MADNLLSDFTRLLRQHCDARGVSCGRWTGARPRSASVLAVGTKPEETLLYVKCRTVPPGFWGLTAKRIADLQATGKPWYAILLVRSCQTGYVLSSSEVVARTSSGAWTLSTDGDHKVNERTDLGSFGRTTSFDSIVAACLPHE